MAQMNLSPIGYNFDGSNNFHPISDLSLPATIYSSEYTRSIYFAIQLPEQVKSYDLLSGSCKVTVSGVDDLYVEQSLYFRLYDDQHIQRDVDVVDFDLYNGTYTKLFEFNDINKLQKGAKAIVKIEPNDYFDAEVKLAALPSFQLTYTEIPTLELRVDKENVDVGNIIRLYFDGHAANSYITYTLTGNNKTLLTDNVHVWNNDYVRIQCNPEWFVTANEKSKLSITVTAKEENLYLRTATPTSFEVQMSELDVELTSPATTGEASVLILDFANRENNDLNVTVKGKKTTLFPEYNFSRDEVEIETPDSWFEYEEGDSVECEVIVEDLTWKNRSVTKKFTLYASNNVLPHITSLSVSADNTEYPILNDKYVANYSKVKINVAVEKGVSDISTVNATFNGNTLKLSKTSTSGNTEYYSGTTSQTIKGETTYKVTVTDGGKRTDTDSIAVADSKITKLQNISLTFDPSGSVEAGNIIYLVPTNYYGEYSYTVTFNGNTLASDSGLTQQAEIQTYYSWFNSVSSSTLPVTISVFDDLGRSAPRQYTITRPYAIISDITTSNVADQRMPSGYGYVANYSKVYVTCEIQWYAESDTVVISGGSAQNVPMTYNSSTGKYEVTTPVITGDTTFTISATDKAKHTTRATVKVGNVTRLSNITVSVNPGSVEIGAQTTIAVSNFVGKYSYSFKSGDKTFPSPSGSDITSSSFSITTPASWFDGYTDGKRRQITVVITDQLGRTQPSNFWVTLPNPKITLDKAKVLVGETLSITFVGRAGRTISYALTEKTSEASIARGTTNSDSPVELPFTKKMYTDVGIQEASFQVVIKALYGTEEVTEEFTFALPELTASIEVDSVYVSDDLVISFDGQAGEGISFDFYYQSKKRGSTFGPYSTSNVTIQIPQYFDEANVITSQNLPVTIKAFDSYNRKFEITGLTILADDDMKPQFPMQGYTETVINPPYTAIKFNGDDRSTLIVEANTIWLGRLFKCEVSNGVNTVTTNTGSFIRPYTTLFAMITEKVIASADENAEFHATVLNSVGAVTYEWWSSADGETWKIISGAIDSTLVVAATNEKLGWIFQCRVTDSNDTVITNSGSFERPGGNIFASIPEKVVAAGDQYASFPVTVLNEENSEFAYRWFASDDGNIWFEVPAAAQVLPNHFIGGITRLSVSGSFIQPTKAKIVSAVAGFDSLTFPFNLQINQTEKTFSGTITTPLSIDDKKSYVTIKDERGMEQSLTSLWLFNAIYTYYTPNVKVDSVSRCNSNGTLNPYGDHCMIVVSYDIAKIYDPNEVIFPNLPANNGELTISTSGYTVSKALGTTYDASTYTYNYDYSGIETYIFPADIEHTYNITVTLRDCLQRVALTVTLPTAEVIMDFKSGGQGVAIGKISEHTKMVEINPTWELKASVKINGQLYDLSTLLESLTNNQQGG